MGKVRADRVGGANTTFLKNRQKIIKTQSVCGICGKPVDISIKDPHDPLSPVVDHIIPIAKGGHPYAMENLQLAHRWCNRQKSDKLINLAQKFSQAEKIVQNNDLPLSAVWIEYKAKS